jgi:hypothetical protein
MKQFLVSDINFEHLFLRYLKYTNLYIRFRNNIKTVNYISEFKEGIIRHASFVDHAFTWSNTTEGHNFWSNIDNSWTEIVYEIKEHKSLFLKDILRIFRENNYRFLGYVQFEG